MSNFLYLISVVVTSITFALISSLVFLVMMSCEKQFAKVKIVTNICEAAYYAGKGSKLMPPLTKQQELARALMLQQKTQGVPNE